MADVGVSLRSYLAQQLSVRDIVSSRIFPDALPQSVTLPAVTYRKISGLHEHYLEGYAGFATARVTFDCYATTRTVANTIAENIASELNGLRGTYTSVDILSVLFDSGPETYEEAPQDGSDEHRYYTTIDFLVNYRE